MTKECSVFFYEGYVGIAPTIINLTKILDKNNYKVTIYGTKTYSPHPGNLGDRVKILYFSKDSNSLFKLFNILQIKALGHLLIYALQCIKYWVQQDRKANSKKSVNIGVDINGGIVALLYLFLFRQPYLFLSLELKDPRKFRWFTGVGILAKLAYKNSAGVIVQDRDRFKILGEYYDSQHPNVFYLPNSPVNQLGINVENGNYFREKFNISPERFPYIILQAGWIGDEVCSKTLAQAFASINNGCALIFNASSKKFADDPYIKLLRQVNSENLFLSLEPVSYEDINKVYAAATIGLAFYTDSDANFSEISMASGKLPQYLKWGKPVLVSNLPSLSKLVEQYQFGVVINDPSNSLEIEAAIDRILSDRDTFSRNAKICFDAEFDVSKKLALILEFMTCL